MRAAFPARMGTPPSSFSVECVIRAMKGKRRMGTIMKMMYSIVSMVLKMTWKAIKFLCGPMLHSIKDLCKAFWSCYKERNEKKAANVASAESIGPNESVQITARDLRNKYRDYKSEDLEHLLELMTDNAVKVDEHPELESFLETYGADQEILKQEIMDELKCRSMKSGQFANSARRVPDAEDVKTENKSKEK
jgi:hypothetical protein